MGPDAYGFSVLPTGYVERWGGHNGVYWKYEYESTQVLFWSATQYGTRAFTVGFHRNSDAVFVDEHVRDWFRLPVRCIKDSE
jgi:Fibrobacter succinogenes major domain (Fib_succ_major).